MMPFLKSLPHAARRSGAFPFRSLPLIVLTAWLHGCVVALLFFTSPARADSGMAWRTVADTSIGKHGKPSMAYDRTRQRVVLFGGHSMEGLFNDMWEWNGTAWTEVAAPGPIERYYPAMTYDPVRKKLVMVGGEGPDYPLYGETREYGVVDPALFTLPDVRDALRFAGGLAMPTSAQVTRYNVVTSGASAARLDLADAALISRKVGGLAPNP